MSEEMLTGKVEDGMKFKFIHPDKITENKLNDASVNNIEELMDSIRLIGLRQPLDVLPEEDGTTYRIIGGHRRFASIKKGMEEGYGWFSKGIPCVIQESQIESTLDEQIAMHEENLSSRNYQDGNYLEGIKTLYMLYQDKSEQDKEFKGSAIIRRLSEKLNVGTRQAYKTAYLATSAEPWITNAVEDRLLTIDAASTISHLDPDKQEALHKYFDEHQMIPKDVLDKYRKNAGKKNPEKAPEVQAPVPEDRTAEPEEAAPLVVVPEENKEPEGDVDVATRKQEVKEMVNRYDDSNFFGEDRKDPLLPYEPVSDEEDYPDYGVETTGYDDVSADYGDYEEGFEEPEKEVPVYKAQQSQEKREKPSYDPIAEPLRTSEDYQMKQMDGAFTWFSEMAEKKEISVQEKAYVDTIVQMLAKFYFPFYVKQGYVDGKMRDTIKEIVDMMSDLV